MSLLMVITGSGGLGLSQQSINVFLFAASQSNMNGQGDITDISGGPYNGYLGAKSNVQLYGALTTGFEDMEAGVNTRTTVNGGDPLFGPEVSFLVDAQTALGGIVYGIKYAPGGVGLREEAGEDDWSPASSGELYDLFFKNGTSDSYCELALGTLLAQFPDHDIKIRALVCANGERDAQLQSTTFEADFQSISDQMVIDLPTYSARIDVSETKVVYNRLKTSLLPTIPDIDVQRIRTAQESYAINNTNADHINSDDLPLKDPIHYDSESTIIMGQRMFTKYLEL